MSRRWSTARWIGMLVVASLLLVTLVSVAVVGWMPRPAAPQMRIEQAVQALRGQAEPASLGLQVGWRSTPPAGSGNEGLRALAAQRLGVPVQRVQLAWSARTRVPDIQVIAEGSLMDAAGRDRILQAQGAMLGSLQWPAFELGVQRSDGRWQVVGSDYSDLASWRRQVLLALLGSAVLLLPLGAWAARRIGQPLRRLADASARDSLQSTVPLPDDGPREVQVLAGAINAGRERVRAQAQEMTRMLAAVAHDLRTPLTGLRLRAEYAPAAQAARMVADIERMDAMIEQVLGYARGELEPPSMQVLDLAPLLEDCAQSAQLRGVVLHAVPLPALMLQGDALLLRRALDNLIDNAARYAGDVELQVQQVPGAAWVEVMDRGPGIDVADRVRLLQPFQRADASRNRTTGGAGLGLAVAAQAARAHGGELQLLDRAGGGLLVRVVLPTAE